MKRGFLTSCLLIATLAAPALAQEADESWCAGLLEFLSTENDANLSAEASDDIREACVAYLRATGGPAADATADDDAPVVLTDAARIWCSDHDFNANHGGADYDDYDLVAEAAGSLGIPVPQPLLDYNNGFWFASHTDWAELVPEDIVSAYFDWDLSGGRAEWRSSDGYARACMAAYELGR